MTTDKSIETPVKGEKKIKERNGLFGQVGINYYLKQFLKNIYSILNYIAYIFSNVQIIITMLSSINRSKKIIIYTPCV